MVGMAVQDSTGNNKIKTRYSVMCLKKLAHIRKKAGMIGESLLGEECHQIHCDS